MQESWPLVDEDAWADSGRGLQGFVLWVKLYSPSVHMLNS